MIRFRKSKLAALAAAAYLFVAIAALSAHFYSVRNNPGDSGESAIPLFLLSLPWIQWASPSWTQSAAWQWVAYPFFGLCVAVNALVFYWIVAAVSGAIRWTWRSVREAVEGS